MRIGCFLLLFFTNGLSDLNAWNIWFGFLLCVSRTVATLISSLIACLKRPSLAAGRAICFALIMLAFTVVVYLLPENGMPPAISL